MTLPVIRLSRLDGHDGFRMDSTSRHHFLGGAVSDAGDVNGDGIGDLIIGGKLSGIRDIGAGAGYVLFGSKSGFNADVSLSGLDGGNGFRMDGVSRDNFLGWSVGSAGDMNGDGLGDVIIGAPLADAENNSSGSSYVVFGRTTGFDATLNLANLNGSDGFRLDGGEMQALSGLSVSGAGDVNGDGFDDVIIGAPNTDSRGTDSGSAYVVFGKASGFDSVMTLSALDGSNGFRLDGVGSHSTIGYRVSGAGDINGDGMGDLIVSTPNRSDGAAFIVFGQSAGFEATIDLAHLNVTDGVRLDGPIGVESVRDAGDINGDGIDDVIVGASHNESKSDFSGSCYVVFGRTSGFDASLNLSSLDGKDGFRLDGLVARDIGQISVSSAGDFNGDGFDDAIVSASGVSRGEYVSPGAIYVIFGKESGFGAVTDFSDLDKHSGVRIDEKWSIEWTGYASSSAGDINGDGFDDVLIGAPHANGNYSGAGYVVFGRNDFDGDGGGALPEITGTADDDTLKGNEAAEHFIAGNGNDNLLGLGGADVFDAGAGDDAIRIGDLTFATIDGGDGNDALHLADSDLNLDLTTLGDRIQGIETICLYGRGDNTLTLTADSLLMLSDSTDKLKVHGNSGDHIVLQDNGWNDGGSHDFYHTYRHDDAVLLVGANVTVEFV